MHENMAYTIVQNCPQTFRDWSTRASSKCNNEKYHCLEDENSRRVEVCAVPNWIKGGILYLKGLEHDLSLKFKILFFQFQCLK